MTTSSAETKASAPAEEDKRSCLQRASEFVDGNLQAAFYRIGWAIGTWPKSSVALSIVVALLLLIGMTQYTTESRGEKLWTPSGSQVERDNGVVSAFFPRESRSSVVYVTPKDGSNVLRYDLLRELLQIQKALEANVTAVAAGQDKVSRTWTFASLCLERRQPDGSVYCERSTILDAWGSDEATLAAAEASGESPAEYLSQPGRIVDAGGIPVDPTRLLGGLVRDDAGNIVSAAVLRYGFELASRAYFDSSSGEDIDPPATAWEEAATKFLGSDPATQTYETLRLSVNTPWFQQEEFSSAVRGDLAFVGVAIFLTLIYLAIQLRRNCSWVGSRFGLAVAGGLSIGLALGVAYGLGSVSSPYTQVHGVLPFLIAGIACDDLFVIKHEFDIVSRRLPAPRRIAETLRHAGASITTTSLTNFLAFMISSTTSLPALSSFCIWAAFAILGAWFHAIVFFTPCLLFDAWRMEAKRADCCCCVRREQHVDTDDEGEEEDRASVDSEEIRKMRSRGADTGRAGGEDGAASPGSDSDSSHGANKARPGTEVELPPFANPMRIASSPAASASQPAAPIRPTSSIQANASSQAPLALGTPVPTPVATPGASVQRSSSSSRGGVCCAGGVKRFLRDVYAAYLVRPVVAIPIVCAFFGFLGACIWGATNLQQEFREEWFIPSDSPLQEWFSIRETYFGDQGVPVSVYVENFHPFDNPTVLDRVEQALRASPKINQNLPLFSWWADFRDERAGAFALTNKADFSAQLTAWLADPTSSGPRWADAVKFDTSRTDGTIRITRLTAFYLAFDNAADEVDAMQSLRDAVDEAVFGSAAAGELALDGSPATLPSDAFPLSFAYFNWEQYAVIRTEVIGNVGLAVGVVAVVVLLVIAQPLVTLLITINIAMVLTEILGCMYFWDVSIDAVSVVNLVLSVGLAVDYSVHIGHSFLHKQGTHFQRVAQTLADMGMSVFDGAASTFVAVVVLAASKSYIFVVFFKMFFLSVVLGFVHGVVLLPIALNFIGPGPMPEHKHAEAELTGAEAGAAARKDSNTSTAPAPAPVGQRIHVKTLEATDMA